MGQIISIFNQKFDLECDYCDTKVTEVERVPESWLRTRLRRSDRKEKDENGFSVLELSAKTLTACPFHAREIAAASKFYLMKTGMRV